MESEEVVAVAAGELVGERVEEEVADEQVVDGGVVEQLHFEENRAVASALQLSGEKSADGEKTVFVA